jgi:hypothetical protein
MGTQLTGTFTMGATGGAGTGLLYTVDYTADLQTLNSTIGGIATAIGTLNTFLEQNFSALAASGTPKSPAATLLVAASALNMIADIMSVNMQTNTETNGSVSSLNTSLAAIAASLSDLGASANIQLAQNMEKNAFEMQAANTAREEAGLPKVEVSHQNMAEKIKGTAATAVDVAAMTNTAGLVQSGINRATAAAGGLVSEYVTAPAAGYIASAAGTVKGWFVTAKAPEATKQQIVQTKVSVNNGLLGGN